MKSAALISVNDRPEELAASRLFRLIGVFVAGLLLVAGLKAFFSHFHDELGQRSANERARLFIGEEIVKGIQEIEKDVYHMTTLVGEAAQERVEREIQGHVAKLQRDLKVLKEGGVVRRELDLNLEGHDQMVREVRYQPSQEASALVMELIEIAPLLDQAEAKVSELRELLSQRMVLREKQDSAGYFRLEQRITLTLKHLPPYFLRLHENANRLFFESSQHLQELEQRLEEEKRHYQMLENLLVLLVIVAVTVAGALFARDIKAANQRLRLAWEEMRAAKEEAERASRAKSDFVSRMSHELRTPMNAILGFAQLLEGENLAAEQRDFVREINRAGEHLLELINQVLDLAKIEAGGMTLEDIPFDPMKTVDEVATLVAERARGQGLYLRFFASPDMPSQVRGDPTRLRQVLINLIGNAIKFTHEGGIDLRIQMEPGEQGERIRFTVHDTGIGMDAATLQRLFKPFAQADESITRKYGGSGLGLMISRDLVRAMGGEIDVESEPGQGSRFHFSLPVRPVADAPPRPTPLAGYRAMMTCSEAHQVEVLQAQLSALGAELVAACGMDAVREIVDQAPERPWVFIGKQGCLTGLASLGREKGRDICLLLPEGGDSAASRPALVDAVLTEPFTYTRLLDIVQQAQSGQTAAQPTPTEPAPPARPLHVLLVEDNRINQVVASRMLDKQGVTHDLAQDGREALEKLQSTRYDLVLMDMQMPVMDGVEATRALRAWEREQGHPPIPVIAMTANAMNEDRELCLASGMNDHLAKPVEAGKLAEVLERWGGG